MPHDEEENISSPDENVLDETGEEESSEGEDEELSE